MSDLSADKKWDIEGRSVYMVRASQAVYASVLGKYRKYQAAACDIVEGLRPRAWIFRRLDIATAIEDIHASMFTRRSLNSHRTLCVRGQMIISARTGQAGYLIDQNSRLVPCGCVKDMTGNPEPAKLQINLYGKKHRMAVPDSQGHLHCTVCGKEFLPDKEVQPL